MALIHHWKLEDVSSGYAANEVSGGTTLTIPDTLLADSSSKFGNGLTETNGGLGECTLTDGAEVVSAISLWYRYTGVNDALQRLLGNSWGGIFFEDIINDGDYESGFDTDNLWHHLWIIQSSTANKVVLYLDGVEGTNELYLYLDSVGLNSFGASGVPSYIGSPDIDNIQCYDHIPTTSEIALLATATSQDTVLTDGDSIFFNSFLPEITSKAINPIVTDISFDKLLPEIESIVINPIVVDVSFNSLLSEIISNIINPIVTDISFEASVAELISSALVVPLADTSFTSFCGEISSVAVNPIIAKGNYKVLPEINSVADNPVVCGVNYTPKHAVIKVKTGDNISIIASCAEVKSFVRNPIVSEVGFVAPVSEIFNYVYAIPVAKGSFYGPAPKISMKTLLTSYSEGKFKISKAEISSVALSTIQTQVNIISQLPEIHSKVDRVNTFTIIKYYRDRQCLNC